MTRITRRGFLKSILALAAAPAIVRADSLMRIVPRETLVWTPEYVPPQVWTHPDAGWVSVTDNVEQVMNELIAVIRHRVEVENAPGYEWLQGEIRIGGSR